MQYYYFYFKVEVQYYISTVATVVSPPLVLYYLLKVGQS